MFNSARIKLTTWYLLIIMFISIAFSVGIYKMLTLELDRVERAQRLRIERRFPQFNQPLLPLFLEHDLVTETKNRLKLFLALINLIILAGSGAAGYFLAGKTLKPIKEMVDEQNRFVTDSSHELRTPLTSLKSEIEVNLRDKNLSLKQAKELLKSNLEDVNDLQVLTDDLIKLSQYQKGENGLVVAKVSLAPIINEAVKKVANLAKNKEIVIENKIKDYLFEGNGQSLVELFVIFLDNAIKYSPNKTKVSLSSEKTDDNFLVYVTDQGVGIDKKEIPHLFTRFYRTDISRTKADIPGYGLGLSIAKQIVEKHNGQIKVRSKLNQGTTFQCKFPLSTRQK